MQRGFVLDLNDWNRRKSESRKKQDMYKSNTYIAMRVSIISVVVNLILSIFKLLAGFIAKSGAMVSDGIHSASDVISTFIVIIGVLMAKKKSDAKHQYGHERMECVAAIILAVILAMTGLGIGAGGMKIISAGNYDELAIPGMLALAAALVSVLVKEWMFWYTRAAARKINSGALMADAWHHRSDSLSSIGALIGIAGARMGFPILDSVASLVICIFIEKAAVDVFRDAIDKMIDKSCTDEQIEAMRKVIAGQNGVERIDYIKTRLFGSRVYVDVEISTDGSQTLYAAHSIAQHVHDAMEENFTEIKHCMVHVNPM